MAYVGQIFSRQRKPEADEPILYGADTDGMLPTLLHPNEWLDGALLPSYHVSLGGAETYFYQNHPVIGELYRRHLAGELNFVGTVATIASADNFDRERNTRFTASLVKWALRADAAVLTKFGGGVPHTDLSETARLLECDGVKTAVQVTDLHAIIASSRRCCSIFRKSMPSSVSAATAPAGDLPPRAARDCGQRRLGRAARRSVGNRLAQRRRRR